MEVMTWTTEYWARRYCGRKTRYGGLSRDMSRDPLKPVEAEDHWKKCFGDHLYLNRQGANA